MESSLRRSERGGTYRCGGRFVTDDPEIRWLRQICLLRPPSQPSPEEAKIILLNPGRICLPAPLAMMLRFAL